MKQKILISAFLLTSLFSSAQFYMNSSGYISLNSTSSALTYVQAFGNVLFSGATSSPTSAAYVLSNSTWSTPSHPDYTWWGDSWTGLYHAGADSVNIASGGVETMGIGPNQISSWCTATYGQNYISHLTSQYAVSWDIHYNGHDNFYVYAGGSEWAYSNNLLSDSRLKQNVTTIPNALNKVLQLRGVTFTYNPNTSAIKSTRTRMGVIAQEVAKVIPEVVDTGRDSLLGVQYANLVGLLIEALKQEDAKVNSLQNIVDSCCNLNIGSTHKRTTNPNDNSGNSGTSGNNTPPNTVSNPMLALQTSSLQTSSSAALFQNIPNPFSQTTTIGCYIPDGSMSASIMIFNMEGTLMKTVSVNGTEQQNVVISGGEFKAGMYLYTLVIDNKEIDTKKMILTQ